MTEVKVKTDVYTVDGQKVGEKEITIKLVADEPCPVCGWTTPNRPKVYDEWGWWWRCYNPDCPVVYYNPTKRLLDIKSPTSPRTKTLKYEEVSPP
jgi:hypothetical protein